MKQPFLDLMDYNAQHPGGDHQTFLCRGQKTDDRFGFNPGSRFTHCSAITPYGMQVIESQFCQVVRDFKVFNYSFMKRLCESPLPDAVVVNIVDNAIRIALDGDPRYEYTMTHFGFNYHSNPKESNYWGPCGCDCLIEWDNQRKVVSLEVAYMLPRVTIIPFNERFIPRQDDELDLLYNPHHGAVDRYGKPFDMEKLKEARNVRKLQKSNSAAV